MMTHHIDQTANKSKRLSALTDAKQFALYALPDFDECLQLEFLSLSASELEPTTNRSGLYSQIYCVLQSGYFKVKHAFFCFAKCPDTTLSKCLRPFQLTFDTDKKPVGIHVIFRRIKVNVLYSIAFEGRVLVYPR
ncbi:DUF4158 domain-containing protein [Photorhabdus bodei]|nr:DUF4158 domain-containing protein [Photorhabdus bodei]